jgi:hypothetical protein
MQELLKIDLPTDKPSDFELITFIETLVTIRNLLNETIIQIEIIEKLINANSKKISENNDFDSSDDSSCSSNGMFVKLIPTIPTPQNKRKVKTS